MNPLMQQLGGAMPAGAADPAIQSARRMLQMYRTAQNPSAALAQLARQNPVVGQLIQAGQGRGGMKSMFYELCQQQGVDPESILSQLN